MARLKTFHILQTRRPKIIEVYSVLVVKARSPRLKHKKGGFPVGDSRGWVASRLSLGFRLWPAVLGSPWLRAAALQPWFLPSLNFSLYVSFLFSSKDTSQTGSRVHPPPV